MAGLRDATASTAVRREVPGTKYSAGGNGKRVTHSRRERRRRPKRKRRSRKSYLSCSCRAELRLLRKWMRRIGEGPGMAGRAGQSGGLALSSFLCSACCSEREALLLLQQSKLLWSGADKVGKRPE